ncbi:MAG TPA: sugar phosphate isomerase/epimerase [Puia sp.]
MNNQPYPDQITCAYLYPITKYGYPPDIRETVEHIGEMSAMGFRSIELEGIGEENILYLYRNHDRIGEELARTSCRVPVLCVVLPQLSGVDALQRARALELFEMGCSVAQRLGAGFVLDNGPLLPMQSPAGAPIRRHYAGDAQAVREILSGKSWEEYWHELVSTYREACGIAAKFNLGYYLHPCEGSLITGTDSFLHFSQAVNCGNLLFNLDTANQFYFKDNLQLSVLRLAGKTGYIHISDNSGLRVEHLVPGDGNIQWDLFFSALQDTGFKGRFAIDIGGAETHIPDIRKAFLRCADWLEEQLIRYSLNNQS